MTRGAAFSCQVMHLGGQTRAAPPGREMIMTQDKALKAAIRARMAEAGEPYSVARHVILGDGSLGGELGDTEAGAEHDRAADQADDYFAIYIREAREAGVPDEELQAMADAHGARERLRTAREAADRAAEFAVEAEEAAERAEERASLAEEAADLAEQWADPEEQRAARQRAERMREGAERAREKADLAEESAELAEERADVADEELSETVAGLSEDETDDDEDDEPYWSWGRPVRPPRPPHPPRPPRPARPHFDGSRGRNRPMSALDHLDRRLKEAAAFFDGLRFDRDAD